MSGYCKYYKQKKQVSYDNGVSWTDTGDYQKGDLYETNSTDCGYVGEIYRWINLNPSTDYYCSDTTKYYKQQKQVSYDGGSSWTNVSPAEYQRGAVYETYSQDCGYVPPTPTPSSGEYLTFVAQETGTFKFSGSDSTDIVSYSLDNGNTWHSLGANGITVSAGNKIMWKGIKADGRFSSTGRFYVEGNVMSIKYGDNFIGVTTCTDDDKFSGLFSGCTGLTSAENLSLPATTLREACYARMFDGCISLTTAPELPATTLALNCYKYMFRFCTNLTTPPSSLPATTMELTCYEGMFWGCSRLTTVPSNYLPATTLKTQCYASMFQLCSSLTTAPALPATTLAFECYSCMFLGCSSLTTAPALPATTLEQGCYSAMFSDCSSLTTAPVLPATTLVTQCYMTMFYYCTSLNSITCLATDGFDSYHCTEDWVHSVSSSGTFTKASGGNWGDCGKSKIPCNWTVQTA